MSVNQGNPKMSRNEDESNLDWVPLVDDLWLGCGSTFAVCGLYSYGNSNKKNKETSLETLGHLGIYACGLDATHKDFGKKYVDSN